MFIIISALETLSGLETVKSAERLLNWSREKQKILFILLFMFI